MREDARGGESDAGGARASSGVGVEQWHMGVALKVVEGSLMLRA